MSETPRTDYLIQLITAADFEEDEILLVVAPDEARKMERDLAAARAEVEALRTDAERYRWLRGDSCPSSSVRWYRWRIERWCAPHWTCDLTRHDLDEYIDADRSREQEPQP